jgi:hypothetical protein
VRYRLARVEGQGVSWGAVRDHADDAGREAERLARSHHAANTRAKPDRNIDHIQVRLCAQELERIGGDPPDQHRMKGRQPVEPAAFRQRRREFGGLLKILPVLDQLDAERIHGGVLFDAVAVRDDDDRMHAVPAGRQAD